LRFAILEYSGVATANSLDVTASKVGSSNSASSGSVTTTANGDLLLGAVLTANPTTFTAGSGYAIEESIPAAPNAKVIAEDQIQATAGSTSATATLGTTVSWLAVLGAFKAAGGAPTLSSIALTPQNPAITAGNTEQFTATGTYSDNSTQNLTATATWTSSATGVATVNSSGLATAVGAGQTTIQAAVGAIHGSTLLTVPGFVATGSLVTARDNHTATLLDKGFVLVAGGQDSGGNALASAELYNPATGMFSAAGSLNSARYHHTTTLLPSGLALLVGGLSGNNTSGAPVVTAELYDPVAGTFTNTGSVVAAARVFSTATLLPNGKVLIAGGADASGNSQASAEIYDPSSGTFTSTGSMNSPRQFHTATLLNNGKVLVTGGFDISGNVLNSAELYDPSVGTFTTISPMNVARFTHTTTLLNNGQVLIAAGYDLNSNTLASAETYDPVAGTFTLAGSLSHGRGSPTATLLNNGQVLFVGGTDQGVNVADAELYDPVARTFAATSNPITARYIQTAALLNNGMVLVAGGTTASLSILSSAELYQPATLVPANLLSIAVSPLNPSIPAGTAQSFIATGTFSDNSTQTLASATWSSSNNAVATISNDSSNHGVAFGMATGSATVSACTGAIYGSTTLTVVAPDPEIAALSPSSGPVGSSLTISGAGFGAIQGASTVLLNQTPATTTSWTPSSIVVTVPNESTGNVVIQVGGVNSNPAEFIVLPTPAISSVSPASGDIGSTVQISGANFGDTQGSSTITLNGTALNVTTWSATNITATVPTGAMTGNVIATVTNVPSNPASFTVTNVPSIFSLTPPLGPVGAPVTIMGADFSSTPGANTVTFNGLPATVTSSSSTSISTTVPSGAGTGPVIVIVAGTASNGFIFTVLGPPNVLSMNPTAGLVGSTVAITGTNFGSAQPSSTVAFDGVTAAITTWTSTQIVVTVPPGAKSGNVTVTASGVTGTAAYFVVIPTPVISAVSPNIGPVSPVTISGIGFGPTQSTSQGTSTVTFNGLPASPTSWSATSIVVSVPNGATTGPVVVTVLGVSSNTNITYTASPVLTGISPSSGAIGSSITIGGVGMSVATANGAIGAVAFTDFLGLVECSATPTTTSDTAFTVIVPSCAATGPVEVFYRGSNSDTFATNGISFAVNPTITSLSPTSGTVGTSVQINGGPFGFPQGNSTVTFNGIAANPIVWTATQIKALPPPGAGTGVVSVAVKVGGVTTPVVAFTINPGPVISTISPATGPVTTSVTISGSGFVTGQGNSTVTFSGTAAVPTTINAGSIVVPVPSGATTGNIVVKDLSGNLSNPVNFTVVPSPSIGSLSQTSGSVGLLLSVFGGGFGATQGSSTVKFGNTTATGAVWSDSQITVPVPTGAATGNVVVTVPGLPASNGSPFTVVARATIGSLSAASGPAGFPVTITGTNYGSAGSNIVTFNGTTAVVTGSTSTTISTTVPEGAATGNIVVTTPNGPSLGAAFTVTAGPGITSISPAKGGIGATITITGAAFGQTQGSNSVKFNNTTATGAVWSDSQITVPVPTGATTGNVVVVVGSATSNGVSFTVSSGFSVTAVTPNSGNTGDSVTITGTGFGTTQGSNTVKFNGATATVTSWTNTSIKTTVPAAATSGPVVVTVSNAPSDGINFTASPELSGISPQPAAAGASVTITGNNFGTSQGTSTFTCNGTAMFPSTWTSSSITVQGCVNGAGPIPVEITVNGVSSVPAVIDGILNPAISLVIPGIAPVGARVLIQGANFGATQGQSTVTVQGVAVVPVSWSDTGIVISIPNVAIGSDTVAVTVAGASALASLQVEILPMPSSLQVSPGAVNLLIGGTQQFNSVDQFGQPRPDATWTVDNASLATITTDASPMTGSIGVLTAVAAGTVTLTATVQGVTAHTLVTISSLASFPPGTVLWSAPQQTGFVPTQIAQAVPTDFGPALYSIQSSSSTGQSLVQAFTADGQQLWQSMFSSQIAQAVPDGFGGLIVTEACNVSNPSAMPITMVDLNGLTGGSNWQSTITSSTNVCPPSVPRIAIRQDGAVVIANPLQVDPVLVVLDGQSGQVLSTPAIPASTFTNIFGQSTSCDCFSPVGPPIVDSDGKVFVEYEVREVTSFPSSPTTVSSILSLLSIALDGTTNMTQLASSNAADLFPNSIMPDGQGGVLATWADIGDFATTVLQAAEVSPGGMSTYNLPITVPQTFGAFASGSGVVQLVLGENGTAFAGPTNFNVNSGAINFSYQVPSNGSLSLIGGTHGGGLLGRVFTTTNSGTTEQLATFDASGTVSSASLGNLMSVSWKGDLNGVPQSTGNLAAFFWPVIDWAATLWAAPGGSPSLVGASIQMSPFPPLPSCPGQQNPCALEALNDALKSLRLKLAGACIACDTSVFSRLGSSYTRTGLSLLLAREPRFYDGTRSNLRLNGLCGRAAGFIGFLDWILCGPPPIPADTCPSSTNTVSQFLACTKGTAVTETPTQSGQGLLTFFDPSKINLSNAATPTGIVNQALLFHEGLHGYTGLSDASLLTDFKYRFDDPSCLITGYLELTVWGGTLNTCGN
jgi:hypothetical protein